MFVSKTTADPRTHYTQLDALRGIAILGVLLTHITGYWVRFVQVPLLVPLTNFNATEFLYFGLHGVSLFFLLSGYLLSWTEEKRAMYGSYSVRSYAARRLLRLVPALWFSIIIGIIIWPVRPSVRDVLSHALFLTALDPNSLASTPEGFTPLDYAHWSLTPEIVFYCLLPLLILKLTSLRGRLVLFGVLSAVSLATRVYWAQHLSDTIPLYGAPAPTEGVIQLQGYLYYLPTTHLWLFIAGVLLQMLVRYLHESPLRRQSILASLLLLSFVVFLLSAPFLGINLWNTANGLQMMLVDTAVIVFFASAVLGSPLLRSVLHWQPLVRLGVISYSLFLLHGVVLVIASNYLPHLSLVANQQIGGMHSPAVWGVFFTYMGTIFAASYAISSLSYGYIESPFLKRKPS